MNREIKFRVRDTKLNKWVNAVPSMEYLLDDPDDACISHHDIDEEAGIYIYPYNLTGDDFSGRLVWEQYTGIKDKNGVDIYEGDIIKWINEGRNYEVYYCKRSCAFNTKLLDTDATHGYEYNWEFWYDSEMEVVGNIHDNPELLKRNERKI